jgi:hypothetical protein
MARKPRTDGFNEMIDKDHKGAKEEADAVVASFVRDYDGDNSLEVARAILKWLAEGDELEG